MSPLPGVSSQVLLWLLLLFYKGTDSIAGAPPSSKPNHLPEAPPDNIISLVSKVSTYECGVHRHSVCTSDYEGRKAPRGASATGIQR
jgi:hypothetical protein